MTERRALALLGAGFSGWAGGRDFLRLVIQALTSENGPSLRVQLALPDNSVGSMARRAISVGAATVRAAVAGKYVHPKFDLSYDAQPLLADLEELRPAVDLVSYADIPGGLARALDLARTNTVALTPRTLGHKFPLPWVGYLPDCQHRRLAHLFSRREKRARDIFFRRMLSQSTTVVVNSQATRADLCECFPEYPAKLIALPFTPSLIPANDSLDTSIIAHYKLPKRFFLISNQFWAHKDHGTAFRALAILHSRSPDQDVALVCTGDTFDWRAPEYFAELRQLITNLRIEYKIHILGHVPKRHQLSLMRNAVAVVQPTRFEGGPGGGAVYDALGLGVRAIVSDIPVNLELPEGLVSFFLVGDAESLATEMLAILSDQTFRRRPPSSTLIDHQLSAFRTTFLSASDHAEQSATHPRMV